MNILNKTKCYLSGALEFAPDNISWRNYLTKEFSKMGIVSLDPCNKPFISNIKEDSTTVKSFQNELKEGKYQLVHEKMRKIRAEDLRMCDLVDWAVVYLPRDIKTTGTIEELSELNRQKKMIFVVCPEGVEYISLWIYGMLDPKYFFNSLESVVETVQKIDSGILAIDSSRFRLLKPEYR